MFRNSYHPAFIIGGLCFTVGVFFLLISSVFYLEVLTRETVSYRNSTEDWSFFISFLTIGGSLFGSGLGIMRGNKIARNIAVYASFILLTGLVILFGFVLFNLNPGDRAIQILIFSSLMLFVSSIILSVVFILTSDSTRGYFGEDKIDEHEDLLDNI